MTTSSQMPDWRIVACIPYYQCRRYIRRAVMSLLHQTHKDITIIVVNDGDVSPPWNELADIHDPRLVRFDLPSNQGPYFASAIVLNATTAPYFLVQDADDWSAPTRAQILLDRLERDGADLAVSAQPQYSEQTNRITETRWASVSKSAVPAKRFTISRTLGPTYAYRAPHHGLFRSDSLRRIGGYYGGFRIGYDTMLTNLILMTGRLSHIPQSLYFRHIRHESLTHSAHTGHGSPYAVAAHKAIVNLYLRCYPRYAEYLAGRIPGEKLSAELRRNVATHISPEQRSRLTIETARLKRRLAECRVE